MKLVGVFFPEKVAQLLLLFLSVYGLGGIVHRIRQGLILSFAGKSGEVQWWGEQEQGVLRERSRLVPEGD